MAKIEINIDEATLHEAEKILHSLGMNMEIAINIFLRRVKLEKGMPFTMIAPVSTQITPKIVDYSNNNLDDETGTISRSNNKITQAMIEEVWRCFLRYLKGSGEISDLSTEIYNKTGMNRGSALIYLNILSSLVKGEPNTRTMKLSDLEYFIEKIKHELGDSKHQNALKSLRLSIPYWQEKLSGNFADKVAALIAR
ncbi:MAG: type II toxin-antitoxin system RelB/DinJ family antitoxin [Dethiosulfatibacter sp.]|nr:type II toxin-antitoxin system RelB/DinJ family antitoxin [Dethiosulfatibacter sp.]